MFTFYIQTITANTTVLRKNDWLLRLNIGKKKEGRKTLTELIKVGTDLSLIETTAKFVKYVFRVPVVDFKVKRADMLFEWTSHLYQASTILNLRKTSYEYGGILTFAMVTISLFVFKRM